MTMPATQMNSDSPTDPVRARIADGVEKIPVPIIRLKIKKAALNVPICLRSSDVWNWTSMKQKNNVRFTVVISKQGIYLHWSYPPLYHQ